MVVHEVVLIYCCRFCMMSESYPGGVMDGDVVAGLGPYTVKTCLPLSMQAKLLWYVLGFALLNIFSLQNNSRLKCPYAAVNKFYL